MQRVLVRDRIWRVQDSTAVDGDRRLFALLDPSGGETLKVLSPPETVQPLPDASPAFKEALLTPWQGWCFDHQVIRLASAKDDGDFAALYSGRISPEPYQFAAVEKLLQLPRPCLLVADDVGLGKTVEAGICLLELLARGRGKRILLIVPPGLIPQWQDEMLGKFGLTFEAVENAVSLDRIQTRLSEGIKPWVFCSRIITSVEFLKKREVLHAALAPRWDAIVVDEAHYLAESGTPRNPYTTARARLGQQLRSACDALILLTATPHNGYSHSFRSLLEIVEPTDATFAGDKDTIHRRVSRNMIRRLKSQIYKTGGDGKREPAFMPREPVKQLAVTGLSPEEKAIFTKVSAYCAKTAAASAGAEDSELVNFAMQIIKKRMLSSRAALSETVNHRLTALTSRQAPEEPPSRAEVRELQGDLPLSEAAHERIAGRVIRSALPKEAKRRTAEKRQLQQIQRLLENVAAKPDPKIIALMDNLRRDVLPQADEKVIIFTEYRDTLRAIREAFNADPEFKDKFVELTGGLSSKQRLSRMAAFEKPETRFLLATDAASEGLNLQFHCRRVCHVELPWNPNRLEQRNGRVDRHGQKRNPIIAYLFYPDSPEDNVLDRLVRKIFQMHDDRVSTPDILGILSGARIEQALTEIDAEAGDADKAEGLMRVFENRVEEFKRDVAPLVSGGSATYGKKIDPKSLSADPILGDDLDFEKLVLARLGTAVRPAAIQHTYSLVTPLELRGPGVNERYPCFTLRRSVATAYPASDVEFFTRLHPLFQAILHETMARLTAQHSVNAPTRRLAVRRHPVAKKEPFAVFTFLTGELGRSRGLLAIAVTANGMILDDGEAESVMLLDSPPGEAKWQEVADSFERGFPTMQKKATEQALEVLRETAKKKAQSRRDMASILREDAESYRTDRLTEIDREEKEAKLAEEAKGQTLLLEVRDVSGFQKRRAAVDTFHRRRLEEIAAYESVPEPEEPQPLGVAFVMPPAKG